MFVAEVACCVVARVVELSLKFVVVLSLVLLVVCSTV